ncbi:MAG TPA: hypothetical protein G4O09_05740 [Dehalococcoidia bacterium]|nr:hypothetical protein [Dehalococcoidia bacterium]
MQWQVIVALAVVIPIILIPVLFVWYLNIGGVYSAIKARQAARAQRRKVKVAADAMQRAAIVVNEESAKS